MDAIGWLQLMTGDRFPADALPHWSVTFSVHDTDAIAERMTLALRKHAAE